MKNWGYLLLALVGVGAIVLIPNQTQKDQPKEPEKPKPNIKKVIL